MLLQLKTGKVINISLDQYLDMSDEEYDFLNNPAYDIGDYPGSIWQGSQISKKGKIHDIDESLDYVREDEDKFCEEPLSHEIEILDITLENLSELPEENIEE